MNKKNGSISVEGHWATITFKRQLPFSIEKVWEAITNPEQREQWFGPTTIEPEKGGAIETIAEGPPAPVEVRRSKGKIISWDPPRLFEYEEESSNAGKTIIRFELQSLGNETLFRLTNSGISTSDAGGYAPGWHAFIDRLESYLENKPLPDWGQRYGEVQPAYEIY